MCTKRWTSLEFGCDDGSYFIERARPTSLVCGEPYFHVVERALLALSAWLNKW